MLTAHGECLLSDAKKICKRCNILMIENNDGTWFINGKLCKSLKLMLTEVYRLES